MNDENGDFKISLPSETLRQMRRFTESMTAVAERASEIKKRLDRSARRIAESLPSPTEFERALEAQVVVAEEMARAGWTIPLDTSPRYTAELLNSFQDDLDEAMVQLFHERSLLESVEERLSKSEVVEPWWLLVEECFDSYRDDRYAVTIPGLLAVIEGVVVECSERTSDGLTNPIPVAKSYVESFEGQPWRFRRVLAVSVKTFLIELFGYRDFGDDRPAIINRSWILHGRDRPGEWEEADALRLFNALDTIALTFGDSAK